MFTKEQNPWMYLILLGVLLASGPRHDAQAQTKTDLQSSKRIYITFDDALGDASGTLHAMKLGDVLKRTTTVSLPKGPQGGVEVTFVAVIAQNGKVLTEWASNPVLIKDASLRLLVGSDGGGGEIRSPWDAFQEPLVGYEDPALGFENPIVGFGDPLASIVIDHEEHYAKPSHVVKQIWNTHGEVLRKDLYALVLMAVPRRDYPEGRFTMGLAIVPFTVQNEAGQGER